MLLSARATLSVAFPSLWVERSLSKRFRRTMTVSSLFGPMIFNWNCLIHIGASENYRKSLGSRLKRKISLIAFSSFEITWSAFIVERELNKMQTAEEFTSFNHRRIVVFNSNRFGYNYRMAPSIFTARASQEWKISKLFTPSCASSSPSHVIRRIVLTGWLVYSNKRQWNLFFYLLITPMIFELIKYNTHMDIHSASNESSGMATSQKQRD